MWYDYQPPKSSSINEVCKRLEDAELFPGDSPRTHKLLSRLKAASLISMCPETVDLIFDILDRYYVGTRFYDSQLEDLKKVRYDVYLAVDKYIKLGKIVVHEPRITAIPESRKVNVPRRRARPRTR